MENKIMTYDLVKGEPSSQPFYQTLDCVTEIVSNKLKKVLGQELIQYQEYIEKNKVEQVRSVEEYGVEIVLFGILYRWYLKEMHEFQKEHVINDIAVEYLQESFEYFQQSGEFKEEVLRFKVWMCYFQKLQKEQRTSLWEKVFELVKIIDKLGEKELVSYLPKVNKYIDMKRKIKKERKDSALLLRDKSCYYINMIGASLFNQQYKDEFAEARSRYVFVPGCMASGGSDCKAKQVADGFCCSHCTMNCIVSDITKKCALHEVSVRILYHESEMKQKKVDCQEKIGVVGVACVLNLLSGGWKARRLNYIPQCVFLDYCGCKQHWSESGIITSMNKEQLYKKLYINR